VGFLDNLKGIFATEETNRMVDRFPSKVGSFGYDAWGFNADTLKSALGLAKLMYEKYFRVEAYGLENIPKEGRVLIIANHSGQLPLDGFLLSYSLLKNPHAPRVTKAMMERFIPTLPFLSNYFAQIGGVVGDPINCARMLEAEEAIVVFPEGSRGISKPFNKRYQLQKFGTGFMNLAVNHSTPVIPVGIVGCEESIISMGNPKKLAKMFGLPSAPILLPAVFPTKVIINIGEPMYFDPGIAHEVMLERYVEDVKYEINALIKKGLKQRKGIFAA
jgi:1-acyl-sn-glycerol-3-phosphate acyltransferase